MTRLVVVIIAFVTAVSSLAAQAPTWDSVGPVPRTGHSAVIDPVTQQMVVFGGVVVPANTQQTLPEGVVNDLWRMNAKLQWKQVNTKGARPAARGGHSAVYDPTSNRMIVYGGSIPYTYTTFSDVWVLTNANGSAGASKWVQLSAGGTPTRRFNHAAAFDAVNNRLMVFGGDDCTGSFCTVLSDVWVLTNANGISGVPTWTHLSPVGTPGARETMGSVGYDSATNRLIIFGGTDGSGTMFNDVWVLTNANGLGGTPVWQQLATAGTPPTGRGLHAATYDPITNTLTTFGGMTAGRSLLNDAWILTGANGADGTPTWTQMGPFTTFPEPRAGHSAVYDSTANRMIVFGGATINDFRLATNSAWVLNHANGQ